MQLKAVQDDREIDRMRLMQAEDEVDSMTAPVQKLRSSSLPSTGSPIIFASSPGNETPRKQFVDSPIVRKYQRILAERNSQNRALLAQLEIVGMEKQFAVDELERLRQAKVSVDRDVVALRQEMWDRSAASDLDIYRSNCDTELSEKFHSLLEEKKGSDKYLATIEKQLEEQLVNKEVIRVRLEAVTAKLTATQDEKHRVDIAFMEKKADLESAKRGNGNLQESIQQLCQQLDDLSQQLMIKSMPKKASMNKASFYLENMDMINVSVDADDSCIMPMVSAGSVAGENMMGVVELRLEEKIECLGLELDTEKEARACDRKAAEVRIAEIENLKVKFVEIENEKQTLLSECEQAQFEVKNQASQYGSLLGHQNHKQKIKHVLKLKQENSRLKSEVVSLKKQVTKLKRIKNTLTQRQY